MIYRLPQNNLDSAYLLIKIGLTWVYGHPFNKDSNEIKKKKNDRYISHRPSSSHDT